MTDEEILETGELCAALLSSNRFSDIVAKYELTIAADILATAPDASKRREELYASLWGARGLLEFMKLNADAAGAILASKQPSNEDAHPVSTNGFVEYDDVDGEEPDF